MKYRNNNETALSTTAADSVGAFDLTVQASSDPTVQPIGSSTACPVRIPRIQQCSPSTSTVQRKWGLLLARTALYAGDQVRRWRWRGLHRGILPDGFDSDSIASQAIVEFLSQLPHRSRPTCRLRAMKQELQRHVRRIINRLHHRLENRLFVNEPDLTPVTLDDNETVSVIELIPDTGRRPDRVLLDKEALAEFRIFRLRFCAFLGRERRLIRLLELYCDGCSRTEDLAVRLKLKPGKVRNLKKQFLRRWAEFHGSRILPHNGN